MCAGGAGLKEIGNKKKASRHVVRHITVPERHQQHIDCYITRQLSAGCKYIEISNKSTFTHQLKDIASLI